MQKSMEFKASEITDHFVPDEGAYRFDQLFNINDVQKIQDAFSEATGVAAIITEIDGTPITRPSGFSVFCNEVVRKTKTGLCNCMKSDAIIGSPSPDGPRMQPCLSGGLLDGGTSIMVGSHHVANWLIGQVLDEDIDIRELYKYCDVIGADPDEFQSALQKVNRMTRVKFQSICNFLYLNAKMLSAQAIKNMVQQEEIARRKLTEEKYRLLFDNAVETIAVIQDGVVKICNPMGSELTGYTQAEVISFPISTFIHPEDRKFVLFNYVKHIHGVSGDRRYDFRIIKKDSSIRWVELNSIGITWEGKPATFNFLSDITLRKLAENDLRVSEEKYRLLAEFASDVIWVLNLSIRKYTYVSPSVYQLRGLTAEEAANESVEESFTFHSYNKIRRTIDENLKEFLENPDNPNSYVIEVQQPCRDGSVIWVEVSTKYRYNSDGDIEILGVSRNIDKRKTAEKEILYLSYKDQLTGLYNRRYYEEELIKTDVKHNLPLTLVMVDVNGLKLTNDAFGHQSGDKLLKKVAGIISSVCRQGDTAARIGGDEYVLILPKCSEENAEHIIARINRAIANSKAENIILSISIGFAVKNDISAGINEVFRKAEDNMYKNKLYESSSMRSKTIDLIMNTLYEKNNREMLHSRRVSELCEAIADKMGFDKDDINQIRLAGLMHDIGKIGIDEKILNKPKKLNSAEWHEIHRHSEIGYRILSSVNEFSEIAEYVLAHHERWDGKGYPKALKGEEISLKARIITVADAYDAMTSDRAYHVGLDMNGAVAELKRCSGKQFDENVARIFVEKVLGLLWE